MKYIIYGAGAVGGTIGARLQQSGQTVVFLARGAHLAALRTKGLLIRSPDGDALLPVTAAEHPADIDIAADDRVILCMKSQDTPGVLEALAAAAPMETAIVCAQNGIDNENLALRYFRNVHGMFVILYGAHLQPGVVHCYTTVKSGVLDIGRWPDGTDPVGDDICADLEAAGFASAPRGDIAAWKRAKLVSNVGNALYAAASDLSDLQDVQAALRAETLACFQGAGLAVTPLSETAERMGAAGPPGLIDGAPYPGSSSWQSLKRGGALETDYLNGEIARLARLRNAAAPLNERLQQLARRLVREGVAAGTMAPAALREYLAAAVQAR